MNSLLARATFARVANLSTWCYGWEEPNSCMFRSTTPTNSGEEGSITSIVE